MATHSSSLAWKVPWMEEPGRLQSMGSRRVGHDWVTSLSCFTFMDWRRKWQPTPVFLPGESQGRGAWRANVYGVTQSRTRLKRLSSSSSSNAIKWRSRIALKLTTNPDFAFICYLCSFIHSFLWTRHMLPDDRSMSGSFLECPLPFHSHELGSWPVFLHTWLLNWVSCRRATYFFETSFYFSKQISCKWFFLKNHGKICLIESHELSFETWAVYWF